MENQFEVQRSLGRIEGGIAELKNDLGLLRNDHAGLRAEFNKLEAGRLTRLESAFAVSQAETHTKAKNTAIIWSAIVSIVTAVLSALLVHFFRL